MRRNKEQRIDVVVRCAIELIRRDRVDWASSVTYQQLANETGIDQAQIARDFGSKDGIIAEVTARLLSVETIHEHTERDVSVIELATVDESPVQNIADWCAMYGDLNDSFSRSAEQIELLRNQLMLWASAEPHSPEWAGLGDVYRELVTGATGVVEGEVERFIESGAAVRRSMLTERELVIALGAFIEGMMIRTQVAPDLVTPGLTGRVAAALLTAVCGADETTPLDELAKLETATIAEGLDAGPTD